jgi:thiol-disulfide isomerase/thioredoxin
VINCYSSSLTSTERRILDFQNSARVYSFLFYYGRIIRNLTPNHSYWDFLPQIDNNSIYNKSLPHNLLYKFEIEYLRKHNELESISDFIDFIHLHTNNFDLANYLIAIYIKELVASPSYWERHNKLFDSVIMRKILEEQKNNPYREIYERITEFHFASQKGMEAYNFLAKDTGNQTIKLSDFAGKLVLIDVWATWCGACIAQKPHFYELATNYKNNNNIQFIAISVDSSIDIWKNYIATNKNLKGEVRELFIPNGMRTEFGKRFSINFLPKYILIDREGKIIDSNAPEPSKELESTLNTLLSIN